MKSIVRWGLLAGALFPSAAIAQDQIPWAANVQQASQAAAESNRMVLLHFYSDACPPCRTLEQNVFTRADVAEAVASGFVPVKVHAGKSPDLARRYRVESWPTDVFVTPSGLEVFRSISPQRPDHYVAMIHQVALQSGVGSRQQNSPWRQGPAPGQAVLPAVAANHLAGRAQAGGDPTQQLQQRNWSPQATDAAGAYAELGGDSYRQFQAQAGVNSQYAQQPAYDPHHRVDARAQQLGDATRSTVQQWQQALEKSRATPRLPMTPEQPADAPGVTAGTAPATRGTLAGAPPPLGPFASAPGEPPPSGDSPRYVDNSFRNGGPSPYVGSPANQRQPDVQGMAQTPIPAGSTAVPGASEATTPPMPSQNPWLAAPSLGSSPSPVTETMQSRPQTPSIYGTHAIHRTAPQPSGAYETVSDQAPVGRLPLGNAPFLVPDTSDPQFAQQGLPAPQVNQLPTRFEQLGTVTQPPRTGEEGSIVGGALIGNAGIGPWEPRDAGFVPASQAPPAALDGFCPVTLLESLQAQEPTSTGAWKKGDAQFGAIHRGKTYLFVSEAAQQKFLADPDAYSPVLAGCDPVRYADGGELVEGKRAYGLVYGKRIFLFADETSLDRFAKTPAAFAETAHQAMLQTEPGRMLR